MVTIADVAKQAGVSPTTVSHALSGKRPVAPETQARIAQVIKELNFYPNALARSLRIQHTQVVALIIPDITTHQTQLSLSIKNPVQRSLAEPHNRTLYWTTASIKCQRQFNLQ